MYDTALVDPREVAQHQFGIVKVHDHRFTNIKQSKHYLEFVVEFDDNNTPIWQPWSPDIRDNKQIHTYLEKNNLLNIHILKIIHCMLRWIHTS